MQDRLKIILMLSAILVLASNVNVLAVTGKGTKTSPFVVSSEKGLNEVLTRYTDRKSWVYIAVDDTVAITKTIQVEEGKFRIYASGGNQTIRRSTKYDAKVNLKDSKYCMKIMGGAQVVFGYNASKYKLILDGSKSFFNDKIRSTGWLRINAGGICTVGVNCQIKNVMNNKYDQDGAPITTWGDVIVNGEITNCQGINGGAIKSLLGTVTINDSGSIHDCISETEGGAVHASVGGHILVNGGQIYRCISFQEGGAIFVKGSGQCRIISGSIKNNKSGESAGAVFSGLGATLIVGTSSGTGPDISYNTASGSGGGIRCNGGTGISAGGTTYIYGGMIHHNSSGKYGGGIACGEPGEEGKSKLIVKSAVINNNSSSSDGGGIWTPDSAEGVYGKDIIIDSCRIENNISGRHAGGIMARSSINLSNSRIVGNSAKNKGGGIYINDVRGQINLSSGYISKNKCSEQGSGIYVRGKLGISSDAFVETDNIVYLTRDTYVDVVGKLKKISGYIAVIDSEIKTNGTILVKAGYAGSVASKELYYAGTLEDEYTNKKVVKKYAYYNLPDNRCLRPSEKVNGYNGIYIILSEKYTISYNKNTSENVENMPDSQVKFWEENILISSNIITQNGRGTDSVKHWNYNKDGSGAHAKPGSEYKLNGDRILYAQWILWQIKAKDRYYVVGQKVTLDKNELLKKVIIENRDDKADYKFCVKQIRNENGREIVSGTDIITNVYINTSEPAKYVLKFEVLDTKSGNTIQEEMYVYVIDMPLMKGCTRFISMKYINTLQSDSRWYTSLNDRLIESLNKNRGGGKYIVYISSDKIKSIKSKLKENEYRITNDMNRKLAEELQL